MGSAAEGAENAMVFNILIKAEDDLFVAHCLELDIVAAGKTFDETRKDIISLVCAQVDYAFSNNNLENLYHPAPPEVWREFYACRERSEERFELENVFARERPTDTFVPPWIIAHTCRAEGLCHA